MSTVSEEKKWLEFIPFIENSPINFIMLRELLQTHPDIEFVNYMCNGIRDGFDTMITNADLLTFECRNIFSARSQPAIVKRFDWQRMRERFFVRSLQYTTV